MKSLRKTLPILAATVLGFGVFLAAQSQPPTASSGGTQSTPPQRDRRDSGVPQSEAQSKISVNSSLVILPVTVKDRTGNLVPDLRRDEFRVFEDNIEQHIDVFTAEAFPLSMIILLDNDLKEKDANQVRTSLDAIVGGMSLEDEAFVCRFDQFFHPGKGFTGDRDALLTELQRTTLDSEPAVSPPGGAIANGPSVNGHSAIGDQADVLGAESIAQSLNNRVRASSHPKAKGRSAPSSTIPSTTCLSDGALLRRPAIRRAEARHPLDATRTQAEGRGNRAARNGQSRKLVWRFRRRMHRS